MTEKKIREMLLDLLEHIDHDTYKSFLPECTESSPEELEEYWQELIAVVRKHVK